MNVLLINPLSPDTFWTLPDLCRFEGSKTLAPPLGLITVAAMLPSHWKLRLVDLNTRKMTEEDWQWAELVFISGMIAQRLSMLAIIREAKQRNKTVAVGGPYATSVPHDVLAAGADLLFQGEAETKIQHLVQAIEAGEMQGVFEFKEKPNLNVSPNPRYDLLTLKDYVTIGVQTSRGCPFNCEFCDIVNLYGRKPRYKSADQVIKELETIYNLGWRRDVFMVDDNFIGNKSHAKSLLRELIRWNQDRGKPFGFWCQASINLGQDLELIDLMTEANFYQVFVGIESPDSDVLETTRKFQNVRNPLLESIENIKKNGLGIVASFIIGFDNEKQGTADRICRFVTQSSIPIVMLNMLQAMPNTQLWDRLKSEGRLFEGKIPTMLSNDRPNFVPSRPLSEILTEFTMAWRYLYEPSRFLSRAYDYYATMRPTRRATMLEKGESDLPLERAHKDPLRRKLLAIWALMNLVWWKGIVSAHRVQFWKQLLGIRRKNPSRFVKYMLTLLFGHIISQYALDMLQDISLNQIKCTADGQDKTANERVSYGDVDTVKNTRSQGNDNSAVTNK